jgi:hypothetical protein
MAYRAYLSTNKHKLLKRQQATCCELVADGGLERLVVGDICYA